MLLRVSAWTFMGTIMAAWKDDGKTGALLCWVWADEQQGEGVTVCECVCVCVHACMCACTPRHSHGSVETPHGSRCCRKGDPLRSQEWALV